jgi:hypothetical protein
MTSKPLRKGRFFFAKDEMDEFKFGELRERTLHKQLKALYRPEDGETEWSVGGAIADLWSPTLGVIEIQTRTLSKLRTKVAAYLDAGLTVTVVHPLAYRRTIVTWNADRTEELRRRKSPKRDRVEAAFREIGSLSDFLVHPRFTLVIAEVDETEHRSEDGKGSWRRQGRSKVDRVLDALVGERRFGSAHDYRALVPGGWVEPGTVKSLAEALSVTANQAQAFVSCLKKLGILEVCGRQGRAHLLRRVGSVSGSSPSPT